MNRSRTKSRSNRSRRSSSPPPPPPLPRSRTKSRSNRSRRSSSPPPPPPPPRIPLKSKRIYELYKTKQQKPRRPSPIPPPPPLENCVDRSKLKLLPHQKAIVNWLDNHRGLIAVHNTGSGKTLAAVTASQCFLDNNPFGKVLVVAPVSLLPNFKKEMLAYGGIRPNDPHYEFYSYERFMTEREQHKSLCSNNMLIIDEAHELRTRSSLDQEKFMEYPYDVFIDERKAQGQPIQGQKALKLIDCAQLAKRVLLLTATPFINNSYDVANLLAMVKGTRPLSPKQWEKLRYEPELYKNYFRDCFHFYNIPKTKANKYPEQNIVEVFLEMDYSYYSEYHDIEQQVFTAYTGNVETESFLVKLRTALLALPDSVKVNYTFQEILDIIQQPKAKIAIYSNFVESGIYTLVNLLAQNNIPFSVIIGEVPEKKRQEMIDLYNSGKTRVFLISKAGQRGIDLKETTKMIVMDVPWNQASLDQVIGRVARYESHTRLSSSKQKVEVEILYTTKPKDVRICDREHFDPKKIRELVSSGYCEYPSVDEMLRLLIKDKIKQNNFMMELIQSVSV